MTDFEKTNKMSKSTVNLMSTNTNNNNNNNNNSYFLSKKLMKLNSGAVLNSIDDYSLSNLEDKMFQLEIGKIKTHHNHHHLNNNNHYHYNHQNHHQQFQKHHDPTSMFRNISFDSFNNLKNRKFSNNNKHNNNNNNNNLNDQFEAYRLETDNITEAKM